jgi:hypothetical protein
MGWTVAGLQTEPHRRRANPNFEAGLLIFLLPDTILQSPGELSPCLLFGESGSFLSGIVLTKPTIHSECEQCGDKLAVRACAMEEWWVPVGARPNHVEPGQIRVCQIPFGAPSLAWKSGDALRASPPLLPKSDTLKYYFFIWRALQLKEGHSYTPNVPLK